MTTDKLQTANELSKRISEAQKILDDSTNKPADVIIFSTAGGNGRTVVCSDVDLIESVRVILVAANQAKVNALTTQFNNL